ncbi:sialate:O-sulfotransferase 1-like [Saccoglossus kowalevskii]
MRNPDDMNRHAFGGHAPPSGSATASKDFVLLTPYCDVKRVTDFETQNTRTCNNCSVGFGPWKKRPLVALASFPGSGNTWVRHLLETASGFYTGSIYNDEDLYNAGFLGEKNKLNEVLVVKTHDSRTTRNYPHAIHILRNPYDAILSEVARLQLNSHVGIVNDEVFKKKGWPKRVMNLGTRWKEHSEQWLKNNNPTLLVMYEKLKHNPVFEVHRMMMFLNLTLTSDRLCCLEDNIEGKFHRRRNESAAFNPYPNDTQVFLDALIDDINWILKERKYDILLPSTLSTRH